MNNEDTFDEANPLSRGQQIAGVEEAKAVRGPLKPGEMSLHHGRCFQASAPSRSNDRRIGCAIRYLTPNVRSGLERDYAMLVRGQDRARGWINLAGPRGLFDLRDLALCDEVLAAQSVALTAGAAGGAAMYGGAKL